MTDEVTPFPRSVVLMHSETQFPVSDREARTECPYCGRMVAIVNLTERGRIMQGHRAQLVGRETAPNPLWCPGGGRVV